MHFPASLGLLWKDLTLPGAIHAAGDTGFSDVECHWPYATPTSEVRAAQKAMSLPLLSLDTHPSVSGN